ncbi:hypothetical protein H9Q73_000572 [Fusarium xylarioides]|nr:hypothetical protein H9Q73_000572 [Fusarium xylarioides]
MFSFSQPVDTSSQYFLVPLYVRQAPESRRLELPRCYGLVLQKGLSSGNREFIRVGTWEEQDLYSCQLSPMIANTITKLCVGKHSASNTESLTENERVFDFKLGEFALGHVDSNVLFPKKVVKRVDERQPALEEVNKKVDIQESEAAEQDANEKSEKKPFLSAETVKCSLLPQFTTAQWGTISLV